MTARATLFVGLLFVTGCCCGKNYGPSEKPADKAAPPKTGSSAMAGEPRGSDVLEAAIAYDEIIRQMVQADFDRKMEDAERLLATGQYDAALAAVDRAEEIVKANALYLPSRGGVFSGEADHFRRDIRGAQDRKIDAAIRAGRPFVREKL